MKNINNRNDYLPSEDQELLLMASLMQGDTAIHAWEKWINSTNLNTIDYWTLCMLPLLMKNISLLGISHPIMNKFKGIYRKNWFQNQLLFFESALILDTLQKMGIETLVLKGAVLCENYYKDLGLRHMADFDLLIHPKHFLSGVMKIIDLGWEPIDYIDDLNSNNLQYLREVCFKSPTGKLVDLHNHIFFASSRDDSDHEFWSKAIPFTLKNQTTLALNPTDQLFHICQHGFLWQHQNPMQWVADAVTLLNAESNIDWKRFKELSEKWEFVLTMRKALEYLKFRMQSPIPEVIISEFQDLPISRNDYIGFQVQNLPEKLFTNFRRRIYLFTHFVPVNKSFIQKIVQFPRYLKHTWKTKSVFLIPFYALIKILRRLRDNFFVI